MNAINFRSRFRPESALLAIAAACLAPSGEVIGATLMGSSDYSLFSDSGILPLAENSLNLEKIAEVLTAIAEERAISLVKPSLLSPAPSFSLNSPDSRSLSFQTVIDSFKGLRWDFEGNPIIAEVPVLPQTPDADVNKGVYYFPVTPATEAEEPAANPVVTAAPAGPTSSLRTASTDDSLGFLGLPRYGGPLSLVSAPQIAGLGVPRPISAPAVNSMRAAAVGDGQVNVTLPSEPKAEIVDVNTFLRKRYRTNVSDMIEKLEKSLHTKVDVQLRLMPESILANPYPSQQAFPSSYLQPKNQETPAPIAIPDLPPPFP